MFNLDQEIERWRQEMAAAGMRAPEIISELESHLREDIAQQLWSGTSAPVAFKVAIARIGQPTALKQEFDRATPIGIAATLRAHKWKILLCAGLGMLSAMTLYLLRPALHQSEAKLLIRTVVVESRDSSQSSREAIKGLPDDELAKIMSEEVEILTSMDLARDVAESVGPQKILAKAGGGNDFIRATMLIREGLIVETRPRSHVLRIAFRHPDASIVQSVLREAIERFLRLHVAVHRAGKRLEGEIRRNGFESEVRLLGVEKVSNITQVQSPSPFFETNRFFGLPALLLAAGIFVGFCWVLAIKLHHDFSERAQRRLG